MESALKVGISPHWEICTESWWYMGSVQREERQYCPYDLCIAQSLPLSTASLCSWLQTAAKRGSPWLLCSLVVLRVWWWGSSVRVGKCVWKASRNTKCKGQQKLAQEKKQQIWCILFTWCLNVESKDRKMISLSISCMFLLHSQLSWHPIKALYKCKSVENKLGIRAVQDQAGFGTVWVCNQAQSMGQEELNPFCLCR